MNRFITTIFLTFACLTFINAQAMIPLSYVTTKKDSIDEMKMCVQYHLLFREHLDSKQMSEDLQVLEIGNKIVKYSSNPMTFAYEHLPKELLDAAKRDGDSLALARNMAEKEGSRYTSAMGEILRNYSKPGTQNCYRVLELEGSAHLKQGTKFYYEEEIPQMEWNLEEGDTTICGYACQRASTTFRGRTWTVWYAPELPYMEGPWKLQGLPGMILKATDSEGDYCFTAIEITQPKGKVIAKPSFEKLYLKVSPKRMEETIVLFYKNPEAYIKSSYGEFILKIMESVGSKMEFRSHTPCLIEKF